MKRNKISWKRIIVFFIIATAISSIFRFDIFELKSELEKFPTWIYILITVLLEGSGVIIGGLIALTLLKKKRETQISFFGTSKKKSLLMAAIPIIILTLIGVNNDFEMNLHLYGLMAITGTFIYCVMEEYGWRGYLQEELSSLKNWQKYLIIGILWYLWHLTFLTDASVGDNLFFLAMMIFGSWGIGQVAESTKSILACACFHLIIQIMMFNALIKKGIDGNEKLIILGVAVSLWFIIIKKWEKENQEKALLEDEVELN
ncbi:MAG: CPBP family intramembrane glutamic endopeptidase [Vicingaceae bacterium]